MSKFYPLRSITLKHLVFLVFSLLFLTNFSAQAQFNTTLRSNVTYDQVLSDIWGYVAPDGTEYALVGVFDGVSIVSLADPDNAVEVAFVPGQGSRWRDLKTWGEYAYVVADQSGTDEGLTIIDLSNINNGEVTYDRWQPQWPAGGKLENCHNLYIDEFGYLYLTGCNLNDGGVLYVDIFTNPTVPLWVGPGPNVYAHDVFVQNNIMYTSDISQGQFSIYDVSDKENVQLLGQQTTPFSFTHNAWATADGNYLFTTDERANAPVAAYDISDPEEIELLDQFRPQATVGTGVIPHNVHVLDQFLIVSHYTDGGVIVDAQRPHNLVEIANYDTYLGTNTGFSGCWGAYPFLPSGLVLLTSKNSGLHVIEVDYQRACYLEGNVTDAETGVPLGEAEITIVSTNEPNVAYSDLSGNYATGLATAGTYEVTVKLAGYLPFSTEVSLNNGTLTLLDAPLQSLPRFSSSMDVAYHDICEANTLPLTDALVILAHKSSGIHYVLASDAKGEVPLDLILVGEYDIYVGKWGYSEILEEGVLLDGTEGSLSFVLQQGYNDSFTQDYGWNSINGPGLTAGTWVRGAPEATVHWQGPSNPGSDLPDDLGNLCYVTGRRGGSAQANDVDNGSVTLASPPMVLDELYEDPILRFHAWFSVQDVFGSAYEERLEVWVDNGNTKVQVLEILPDTGYWRPPYRIRLRDHLEITNQMTVEFVTEELADFDRVVEAAIDGFKIEGAFRSTSESDTDLNINWVVGPNPFRESVSLGYDLPNWNGKGELNILDVQGRILETRPLYSSNNMIELGEGWPAGIYIAQIVVPDCGQAVYRIVKQ